MQYDIRKVLPGDHTKQQQNSYKAQTGAVTSSLQKLKMTRDTTTTPNNSKADAIARKGAFCQLPAARNQ